MPTTLDAIRELVGPIAERECSIDDPDFLRAFTASSSNENAILASASSAASPGTYTFQVHSLVMTHQMISGGFADADSTRLKGW